MLDRLSSLALLLTSLLIGSCTADTVPLNGLPCDAGACGSRWVCHPETNRCVPEIAVGCDQTDAICPSAVNDGDACPSDGSFIPCDDTVTDCSLGCRTCEAGSWSVCSTPGDCDTCTDYYRDDDRDGTGVTGDSRCLCEPTAPYDATTDGDCDDSAATGADCTDTCITVYADTDGDSLGDAAAALSACTVPGSGYVADDTDCDDGNANCGADCTDDDSDGWCLGIDCDDALGNCTSDCTDGDSDDWCLGTDCDDTNGSCTDDCTACPTTAPESLTLTVTNASPINPDDTVDLEIDMGSYTRNVTSELTCTATSYTLFSVDFTGESDLAAVDLDSRWASINSGAAPFDQGGCSGAGEFALMQDHGGGAYIELSPTLGLGDYGNLDLSFVAAVNSGSSGSIDVGACCTNGCNPASLETFGDTEIGGANACSTGQVSTIPDQCTELSLRWDWPAGGGPAGVDDIVITGTVIVPAVTAGAPGIYTTSFTAGPPGTFDITCTWENAAIGPSVDDTEPVTIE